jgi:formylglycine-generating enzyme required for sulfatase activity
MDFDSATWQEAAAGKLKGIGTWLDRRRREDAPYVAYGTLCGLSLWPLVEAAQAGQFLPVVMALGSIAGGVGGNLIAEQVQRWKDRADPVDEAEVAEWVAERVPTDESLREALDTILEMLEAIPLAGAALDEAGRAWFAEALRQEMDRLGNLSRFEVTLVGSGAIAQDHSVAAGAGGVAVGRDVHGDVTVLGPGARQEVYYHSMEGADPAALRVAYLNRLFQSTSYLSLAGIDPKAASSEAKARLHLGAVYTALLTLSTEVHERLVQGEVPDPEMKRLSALAQLDDHPYLVLLGDAGSGKTTFVNFVTLCLAGEALGSADINLALLTAPLPDDEGKDREMPQLWSHGPLLPVRVALRDFAARGLPPPSQQATAEDLRQFLASDLRAAALGDYARHLSRELMEQGALLLLDGLDEVLEANCRREQVKQAVEDFSRTFPRCRVLVTSRTYAYQKQDWEMSGFVDTVLAPFAPGQIHRFVDRWHAHIAVQRGLRPDDAQGQAELLKQAIFGSDRLQTLAERPLLLTLMASLHAWRGGSLPEKREELYADAVDLLLDWWESRRIVRHAAGTVAAIQSSLAEWLKVDRERVRALLNKLAYQAHARQPDLAHTADVPEGALVSGLMALSQNPDVNPAQLVAYLIQRAGLLLPRGAGVYTFPHRTFQEYLAACHLTDHNYPDLAAQLAREEPDRWREVALLAGAKAARGTSSAIWSLVDALCYKDLSPETEQSESDAWGALFAGQALAESSTLTQVGDRNQLKLARVRAHLARILEEGRLPEVERASAGIALARLGDPRVGVALDPSTGLPDITWCEVPAGRFLMGSVDDSLCLFGNEMPQCEVELAAFRASRFPVTVAQFASFVSAGGYEERRYWTEAGWHSAGERTGSHCYGGVFDLPNHPVVGVSWFEAVAFCHWLTEQLRQTGSISPGEEVRLPSEAEWEKAARGTDGRIYPWGNEFDPDKCNMVDTGIGSTSVVGAFPAGASPYGILEMSGNVWEWCRTRWHESCGESVDDCLEGTAPRVLRGGAFLNDQRHVRCSCRNYHHPYNWYAHYGFRVVMAPVPSDPYWHAP